MRSISDIRRDNLIEVIRMYFDGNQTRLAERMSVQQSVISRWIKGHRNIGMKSSRKIEEVSGRPEFWLDEDHVLPPLNDTEWQENRASHYLGEVVADNLHNWMIADNVLNSLQRVSEKAGISQSKVQRVLSKDTGSSITTLAAIANAFGRQAFELLLPGEQRGITSYDHSRFAALPESEKAVVHTFIEFILHRNSK